MISRSPEAPVSARAGQLSRNESPTISTVSTDTEFSITQSVATEIKSGILKATYTPTDILRIDRAGNMIVPGSKNHRVSFADEVRGSPRPIAKVHQVESFKSWNLGNRFIDGENRCVCTIS